MSQADLLPQLTALVTRLDLLAQQATEKGDAQRDRFYYGVLFGLEIARDEPRQIVAEAKRGPGIDTE